MKKKILIVMHTMIGRGAEKVLIDILENFDKTKYELDLFLIIKTGVHIQNIPEGININYLFLGNEYLENSNKVCKFLYKFYRKIFMPIYLKFPRLIYWLKIKNEFDTEIAFLQWYTTHIISKSPLNSKKIGWVHIDLNETTGAYCGESDFKRLDEIVFVSKDAEKGFIKKFPHLKDKNRTVIYNMLDINKINLKSNEKLDKQKSKYTTIAVGSLTKQKRLDRLLKAHKIVIDDGFDIELWILGSGEEEYRLKQMVEELEIENNVVFLGYNSNPYKYIKNADMYIMSSDFEGFSLVVGEAMVLDKPIVSTNCTGPAELLNYGQFGLVVEKDADELANGIIKLYKDKDLQNRFIDKLQFRKKIFEPKSIMKQIEEIID